MFGNKLDQKFRSFAFDLSIKKGITGNKNASGNLFFTNIGSLINPNLYELSGNISFETVNHNISPYFKFPPEIRVDFPHIFYGYCEHPTKNNKVNKTEVEYEYIKPITMLFKNNELHVYSSKHLQDNKKTKLDIKFYTQIRLPHITFEDE